MRLSKVFFKDDDILADSSDLEDLVSPPDSDLDIKCCCGMSANVLHQLPRIVEFPIFRGGLRGTTMGFGRPRESGQNSEILGLPVLDRAAGPIG